MQHSRNILLNVAVAGGAAALVLWAFRTALWNIPPWSYSPPHTQADYPLWFIQARQRLFYTFAPFLILSSAVGGMSLVVFFRKRIAKLSNIAALSAAWPVFIFPLLGYFGTFSFLFIAVPLIASGAVLTEWLRRRTGAWDLWTVLLNSLWAILLWIYSFSWDAVYGD